jgi:transposase
MNYIALDVHKRYTLARVEDEKGNRLEEQRFDHEKGVFERFLQRWESGSPVAIETVGNWYWMVDEIERAGMRPQLVQAGKAKLMMAMVNKSDRLDCAGLNKLQRSGTLPTVWIPPIELRAVRELTRTRTVWVRMRTKLKNRVHATLAKYGICIEAVSDLFGRKGMALVRESVKGLPEHVVFTTETILEEIESLDERVAVCEQRIEQALNDSEELSLLRTIPGIGKVLAAVILLEIGEVSRFPDAEHLASYCGTTPRIHQSGQHKWYGQVRNDVNRYLKHAFYEAANSVCRNRMNAKNAALGKLYERVRYKKNHQKAIGAVAHRLAIATYWVLKKKEEYRAPVSRQ